MQHASPCPGARRPLTARDALGHSHALLLLVAAARRRGRVARARASQLQVLQLLVILGAPTLVVHLGAAAVGEVGARGAGASAPRMHVCGALACSRLRRRAAHARERTPRAGGWP